MKKLRTEPRASQVRRARLKMMAQRVRHLRAPEKAKPQQRRREKHKLILISDAAKAMFMASDRLQYEKAKREHQARRGRR